MWICPYPMGHIQATGIDAAGRKQYRYHDLWRERRDREKFDEMLRLRPRAAALRERVARDLAARRHAARAGAGLRGAPARPRLLPDRLRGLRGGERHLRAGDHAQAPRDGGRRRGALRLPGQERQAPRPGDRRPEVRRSCATLKRRRGGGDELLAYKDGRRWVDVSRPTSTTTSRRRPAASSAPRTSAPGAATVLAAVALAVSAIGARHRRRARKRAMTRADQGGRALPRQHARGRPRLLHRPARLRPLRRRPDDQRRLELMEDSAGVAACTGDRGGGARPDRGRSPLGSRQEGSASSANSSRRWLPETFPNTGAGNGRRT